MNADEAPPDAPLVCQRAEFLTFPPVPSRPGYCSLCNAPVWIANSSPQGHPIWCWECAAIEIAKSDKIEAASPSPAQMVDIEAHSRQPSFVCPICNAKSYHPQDIAERYCGRCRMWVDER